LGPLLLMGIIVYLYKQLSHATHYILFNSLMYGPGHLVFQFAFLPLLLPFCAYFNSLLYIT